MNTQSMVETRLRNFEAKSGKPLAHWLQVIRKSGLERPGEIVTFLKTKHGVGHATAQLLYQTSKGGGASAEENADALVDALFSGKHAERRPVYEAVTKAARALGPDVRVEPRRTYVTLASKTMFGLVRPGAGRVDLGLILPGIAPKGRLEKAKSIGNDRITHRIALEAVADVDAEVRRWLAAARDRVK